MRGRGLSLCLQVDYSSGPTYFMLFTHSAVHDWSSEGSASEPWLIGASRAAGPAPDWFASVDEAFRRFTGFQALSSILQVMQLKN